MTLSVQIVLISSAVALSASPIWQFPTVFMTLSFLQRRGDGSFRYLLVVSIVVKSTLYHMVSRSRPVTVNDLLSHRSPHQPFPHPPGDHTQQPMVLGRPCVPFLCILDCAVLVVTLGIRIVPWNRVTRNTRSGFNKQLTLCSLRWEGQSPV